MTGKVEKNSHSIPPFQSTPSREEEEAKKLADKTNLYVIVGQWFIITTALVATAGIALVVYGLAGRISLLSTLKAGATSSITAAALGAIGSEMVQKGATWEVPSFLQRAPILPGQLPGLKGGSNKCFMNASLQALLALPLFRTALQQMAKKERAHIQAWLKLQEAVTSSQDPSFLAWSAEEIKSVFITLSRLTGVQKSLVQGPLIGSLFEKTLTDYIEAGIKDQPWPTIELFSPQALIEALQFFRGKNECRDFLNQSKAIFESQKKAAETLDRFIENYQTREAALKEGGSELSTDQIDPDPSIDLKYLRELFGVGRSEMSPQEDAAEFMNLLLKNLRSCEHPTLFPKVIAYKEMAEYKSQDPKDAEKIAKAKGNRLDDPVRKSVVQEPFIALPCPKIEEVNPEIEILSGQNLVNQWSEQYMMVSEEDKKKNLMYYENGSYYVTKEGCQFETPPPYLMIHLKRFEYSAESQVSNKIHTKITFKNDISIQKQHYRLVAAITHHGDTLNAGHYTAIIRDRLRDDRFWNCNDESVTVANDISHETTHGYMYFYERVDSSSKEESK